MDLSAIVLDPFDIRHLAALQAAVAETCRAYEIPPERALVAYAAHGAFGQRIVVHVYRDDQDPYLFLWDYDGFGASLSGCLSEKLGDEVKTSTAWSVSRHRRTDHCRVQKGFLSTAEDEDSADDSGPLQRLASKLGVPLDLTVRLLETPNTEWMLVKSPPTAAA